MNNIDSQKPPGNCWPCIETLFLNFDKGKQKIMLVRLSTLAGVISRLDKEKRSFQTIKIKLDYDVRRSVQSDEKSLSDWTQRIWYVSLHNVNWLEQNQNLSFTTGPRRTSTSSLSRISEFLVTILRLPASMLCPPSMNTMGEKYATTVRTEGGTQRFRTATWISGDPVSQLVILLEMDGLQHSIGQQEGTHSNFGFGRRYSAYDYQKIIWFSQVTDYWWDFLPFPILYQLSYAKINTKIMKKESIFDLTVNNAEKR